MIHFMQGKLFEIKPTSVILEVNGIGYEIFCTTIDLGKITPHKDSPVFLYTHLIHREDLMMLYGFLNEITRKGFLELLKVGGIGAKAAINMLSHYDAATLFAHIQQENIDCLTRIPGIGPKMAKKIIFDLKGVLISEQPVSNQYENDLLMAFINLGYKENHVRQILGKGLNLSRDFETDFKSILKKISK